MTAGGTAAGTVRHGLRHGLPAGLLLAGVLLPILPLLGWAVSRSWPYPDLLPTATSYRGLRLLVEPRSRIPQGLATSVGVATAVALLATVIGVPAGRALGLYRFRGRRLVQFLLLAPVIVPGLAVTLGLQVFFIRFNLADSPVGVVLVQLIPTVPYVATVTAGAYSNFDVDYERQARVLGAGPLRTQLFVTLPLLRPALLVAGLFAFLISWSEYVLTFLVGGGRVTTLPLLLFAAIGSADTSAAAALALLVVVPPLLLVAASARLLSGRTAVVIGFGRL